MSSRLSTMTHDGAGKSSAARPTRLRFEKVHGLGNDFVLVDARSSGGLCTPEEVRRLCDRRLGIGADGVLTLLKPQRRGAAARLHIHNSDGSDAEMCGNGLRCAARLLLGESDGAPVTVETAAGLLRCEAAGDEIRVDAGRPRVGEPLELEVAGERVSGRPVSMGNPHFVVFGRADAETARRLGPAIEGHPRFAPGRTNVGLCERTEDGLRLVVWERGCGLTQACGTGACAAAAAAVREGIVAAGREIAVDLPGGRLHVEIAPDLARAMLRGPTARLFRGEIALQRSERRVPPPPSVSARRPAKAAFFDQDPL